MKFEVNQVVIHEGRRCKITELTDKTAKLKNLSPKNESDWTMMEVILENIKEDDTNE